MSLLETRGFTLIIASHAREDDKEKEALLAEISSLKAENDSLKSTTAELESKVKWFEEQIRKAKQARFGKSSEAASNQLSLDLFDDAPVDANAPTLDGDTIEVPAHTRRKSKRPSDKLDTSSLEREVVIHDVENKQCETCDKELTQIGEDRREVLEYIPARVKVIEHVRPKYTCRCCETLTQAPAITKPLSKSPASASLIAQVIDAKFNRHLPYYRQSQFFAQLGLKVSDDLLGRWVTQVFECLRPVANAQWAELAKVNYLQVDETPVKVLVKDRQGYIWVYRSGSPDNPFVLYEYQDSRAAAGVNARLEPFHGLLQTDGYSGYNYQRKRKAITMLGCMAHCRRKFMDIVKITKKTGIAHQVVAYIAKLYALEKQLRESGASEEKRYQQRQEKAVPLLQKLHDYLVKRQPHVPPKSSLGSAITYALNHWESLCEYVNHGTAEIDNNLVENKIRPFALGRRNWLFVGNAKSAEASCFYYSAIQSCLMNDIEPVKYLRCLLNHTNALRRGEVEPRDLLPQFIDHALLQ